MKKISLVLLFAVLFGLLATVSAFAATQPPDGIYKTSDGKQSIVLLYKPNAGTWIIQFYAGSSLQGEYESTNINNASSTYIITFANGKQIHTTNSTGTEIQASSPDAIGSNWSGRMFYLSERY